MEKVKLIKEVVELHRRINRVVRRSGMDAWMELTMTVPQVKSLFFITDNGSTNFKSMATALKVTPSNLTGVVDRLVEQGLVSRTEDAKDRRKTLLKATPKGENLVSDLRERRVSYLSKALEERSPGELQTIIEGLILLAKAVETQSDESTLEESPEEESQTSKV